MEKNNIASVSSQANSDSPIRMASFHGQEIPILEKDGIPYVAMRAIVEGIGLGWSRQLRTIKDDPVLREVMVSLSTTCEGQDGKKL